MTDRFFDLLWISASHLRKSGDGEIELDVSTLRAWLFEKVENELNKDASKVAHLEAEAKKQEEEVNKVQEEKVVEKKEKSKTVGPTVVPEILEVHGPIRPTS